MVITGSGAQTALQKKADLVMDVTQLKHPLWAGIKAEPEVEL